MFYLSYNSDHYFFIFFISILIFLVLQFLAYVLNGIHISADISTSLVLSPFKPHSLILVHILVSIIIILYSKILFAITVIYFPPSECSCFLIIMFYNITLCMDKVCYNYC